MTTFNATPANFSSTLSGASGGDTIICADGSYSAQSISTNFGSYLTIEAENAGLAVFSDFDIPGGDYIRLDGLKISVQSRTDQNATNVQFLNCTLEGGIYFRDVDELTVTNCHITGGGIVFIMNDVTNATITENYVADGNEDVMRITGHSHDILVENNIIWDSTAVSPLHPDIFQIFGVNGKGDDPHDITIRGNFIGDDPTTGQSGLWGQGIFLKDYFYGGAYNILIEQNMLWIGSPNSIYTRSVGSNVIIQDNTLIPWPSGSGGQIRLADGGSLAGVTVRRNVAKNIVDEVGDGTITSNYETGSDPDYAALYETGDQDLAPSWEYFVPKAGGPIDFGSGYGALTRIAELQGGTPTPSPTLPRLSVGGLPLLSASGLPIVG